VRRRGRAGGLAILRGDHVEDGVRLVAAHADLDQRADDDPHHVP
jgi:hypothetical protein